MRPFNEKLASDILEAGKKEFLEKGFRNASMREIAKSIGVTTGAIYRYYKDKESLFDALVKEPAENLLFKYQESVDEYSMFSFEKQKELLLGMNSNEENPILSKMYDYYDAFKLIACCSVGTRYENYIDQLAEIEDRSSLLFMKSMKAAGLAVRELDHGVMHILSTALFNGMFETIRHDMPREKAFKYIKDLEDFYSAGWFKILGLNSSLES